MKHKWLVVTMLSIGIFGAAIGINPPTEGATPYDRYSLGIQIAVGVMLGLYLYYLQRLDNDEIEKVLDKQKLLSEEMHKYIVQQQKIQDSIRLTSFSYIGNNLEAAKREINRMLHYITNYKAENLKQRAMHLDDQLWRSGGFKTYSNAINQQLVILRTLCCSWVNRQGV